MLQGLILGLGTLDGMKVIKSKQGAVWGNTKAEWLFRVLCLQSRPWSGLAKPGAFQHHLVFYLWQLWAWVRQVEAVGEVNAILPVAWGCGSVSSLFLQGLKPERMFSLSGDLHFERGAQRARGGPSSLFQNSKTGVQVCSPIVQVLIFIFP